MNLLNPKTYTTIITCLLSLYTVYVFYFDHYQPIGRTWPSLLVFPVLAGASVLFIIVAARATMVTWITVLVLLAFAGKRRRVLAKEGRKISTDVVVQLFKLILSEKGVVSSVVCAFVVGLLALVRVLEIQLVSSPNLLV